MVSQSRFSLSRNRRVGGVRRRTVGESRHAASSEASGRGGLHDDNNRSGRPRNLFRQRVTLWT